MAVAAGIYARISEDRDGEQLGVERQLQDCRKMAEDRGWTVVEEYVDNDISAYSGKPRPAYRQMLTDMKEGRVNAVIAWHQDRLHRHQGELEAFIDLVEATRTAVVTLSGDLDLSTSDGRFVARIHGAVARKSSEDMSRRIARKHRELALKGANAGGGHRPFGFRQDRITVDHDEADVIRDLAQRILRGESLREACKDLDLQGVSTVTGRPWSPTAVRTLLMSARISGRREHKGEIVADAVWPAIITAEQSDALKALLGDPARRTSGNHTSRTVRSYLLTGMVRCGLCGEKLIARRNSKGRRRYVCANGPGKSGCGRLYVVADEVERLIVDAVMYRLDCPQLGQALHGDVVAEADDTALHASIMTDEEQLAELATAHGERLISLKEWLAARKPIEARITDARRQVSKRRGLTAVDRWLGKAGELRDGWDALSLNQQRAIVACLLDHAVITPGVVGATRFDPNRVKPLWRV